MRDQNRTEKEAIRTREITLSCKGQEDGLWYSDRVRQDWGILFLVKDYRLNHCDFVFDLWNWKMGKKESVWFKLNLDKK